MKKLFRPFKSFFQALLIITTLSSFAQQQFIHTASKTNNAGNGDATWLDKPELNNNPSAILFVKPELADGQNLNPHPIGVFYFQNKWNIFNLDQRAMTENARFNVTYFTSPDKDHFRYTIKQEDIQRDGAALINHPALNGNPNVQVQFLNCWGPEIGLTVSNRDEVVMPYNADAGKWAVTNINKKPLFEGVTYNIAISSGGIANAKPVNDKIINPNMADPPPTGNSTSTPISAMYMTVWALENSQLLQNQVSDGIKIPGDNIRVGFKDKIQIFGFEMGASLPNLIPSGIRSYEPITIKIHTGVPATNPLFEAFVKYKRLTVIIETFSNTTGGTESLNYSIKLTGAAIVSFKQIYEEIGLHLGDPGAKKYLDEIKIWFTQIEYNKDGNPIFGK